MSIKQFKFVSPGVFVNEIDQSQVARQPEAIGPVIIGQAEKGPNLIPVTCQSYEEFYAIFGESSPGLGNADSWRKGNNAVPTYGSYAAQAYFRNGGPVTFVKLAGVGNDDAYAGWSVPKAHGLFVGKGTGDKILAAVVYSDDANFTMSVDTIDTTKGTITLDLNGAKKEISFDKTSPKFIRKVLNTNPTLTNAGITLSNQLQEYWLGQSYETNLNRHLARTTTGDLDAHCYELFSYRDWRRESFVEPATGWVISQIGSATTTELPNYDTSSPEVNKDNFTKLFRLHSIRGGEWEQKNIKISIEDIKPPANETTEYGTFSVVVRKASDTDVRPKVIERFTGLNLNQNSDNFIAKVIGDTYYDWRGDPGFERYQKVGNFANNSNYIRVSMAEGVEFAGRYPFGFEGPVNFAENAATEKDGTPETTIFPTYLLRESSNIVGENLSNSSQAYFGVTNYQHNGTTFVAKHSDEYGEHSYVSANNTYSLPGTDPDHYPEGSTTQPGLSFIFTLDDLIVTDAETTWAPGNFADDTKTTATQGTTGSAEELLETHNRFTMPLFGGLNGLNIKEKDPFADVNRSDVSDTAFELTSVERALNTVSDPEVVEMNLLAAPGINNPSLTSKMVDVCETRGDALAIIDIQNDYIPSVQSSAAETSRLPQPKQAAKAMADRALNSSYGACFFPWVTIRDEAKSKSVDVPPSVAMMGVMASSAARSELWFAPAGFTRGGLSQNGAAGLPVVDVKYSLSSRERDTLYENNINPIASFPNEGIVVFGQKTLQLTQSALDRINVRRLMIYVKKEISRMAATLLFEPNVNATWSRFLSSADPFLRSVQSRFGITEYKLILDETTTTPELIDRNIMYAKIFLKPARAIEYIALDFTITNTGASFEDL